MSTLKLLWFFPASLAVVAEHLELSSGLRLSAQRTPSSERQFEALAQGEVDAVVTAMDNVMDWNLRPGAQDLRIIAQLEKTTPLSLVGRAGLQQLTDLRGATLLVDALHNGFVVALRHLLHQAGLIPEDYTLRAVGGVQERMQAMLAGEGAATLLGPPFDAQALGQGLHRLASVQQHYPQFPGQGLVVSRSALPRLRPVLSHWLHGLEQARLQIGSAAAQQALLAAGYPAAALDQVVQWTPATLRPDPAGVQLLIAQRLAVGLPSAASDYASLVDDTLLPVA
jgi:hypothetical protein